MKVEVEKLSVGDLNKKIEAIKAERERTANALQRYEEELERRKQEVPLGVPEKPKSKMFFMVSTFGEASAPFFANFSLEDERRIQNVFNTFNSWESAEKHAEMLLAWRKALVANSKEEPIDIKVLLPLLKKGKVLYSPYDEKWKWVEQEAVICAEEHGWFIKNSQVLPIDGFNIKPAENWEDSLMECGL